jgi:hypothetical protein
MTPTGGFIKSKKSVPEVRHRADHRKHDPDLALSAGTQNGPQLAQEQLPVGQGEPDPSHAEKGVVLPIGHQVGHRFVAPDIQRADEDGSAPHLPGNGSIDLDLLLFAGGFRSIQKQKFGAEQTNPFGAVFQRRRQVGRPGDIGGNLDPKPVRR